jgi:hypothetical protein
MPLHNVLFNDCSGERVALSRIGRKWTMLTVVRATGAALVLSMTGGAVAQSAPTFNPAELLSRALTAPTQTGSEFAFDFVTENTGNEPGLIRGRYDPSRPKGDRVSIIEATGKDADPKKIDERYEKQDQGDIWCDAVFGGADGAVTDRGVQAGGRALAFIPKPNPNGSRNSERGDAAKLFKQLTAVMVVDEATADVKSFAATLGKPWKPAVVAKLEAMQMKGSCAAAPNGRMYLARTETSIQGSALGQSFKVNSVRRISNLAPVN